MFVGKHAGHRSSRPGIEHPWSKGHFSLVLLKSLSSTSVQTSELIIVWTSNIFRYIQVSYTWNYLFYGTECSSFVNKDCILCVYYIFKVQKCHKIMQKHHHEVATLYYESGCPFGGSASSSRVLVVISHLWIEVWLWILSHTFTVVSLGVTVSTTSDDRIPLKGKIRNT